jgi:hypothetical protein
VTEPCARPGCGHGPNYHDGVGCFHDDDDPGCPCPSYRTQAQQEAWEDAKASHESYKSFPRFPATINLVDQDELDTLDSAVERLLELYP